MALTQEEYDAIVSAATDAAVARTKATKKKRNNFEKRLVAEYVGVTYPTSLQWRNVRLGEIKNQQDGKMYAFLRRWADAIVITMDEVVIIEGKVKPAPGVISQLQLYMTLFPKTPEYTNYRNWNIRGEIVCALNDEEVENLAKKAGLNYVIYEPTFIDDILATL